VKILQRITTKKSELDNKQFIVDFGHWGNPRDSFIRCHQRRPVQEVKNKLQKWCEVVDVDEFSSYAAIVIVKWQMSSLKERNQ
jgi:hypothetical protein